MAQFRSKPFGVTKNGDKVDEYIISNPGGLEISVLNYGCVIKNLFVPTKTGPVDVVVGHDTLADYEADFNSSGSTCCGAFVGRYANRIENAEFSLSGKTYKLEANNGKNHLHGTFPRKIYDVKMFGDTLLMETESPADEDGFPGNLKVSVRYILTPDNTLRMDYRVSTDEDTIINLTNHTYCINPPVNTVSPIWIPAVTSTNLLSRLSVCTATLVALPFFSTHKRLPFISGTTASVGIKINFNPSAVFHCPFTNIPAIRLSVFR